METVSIYFFNFSAAAPGVLKDYCIVVPTNDSTYHFETLSQIRPDVISPIEITIPEDLALGALRSPLSAAGLIRSYECPVDLVVKFLAALTGQFLDQWAVLSWDAIDKPLLHDLVAHLQRVGKRLEGRVLRDCS